MSIPLDQAFEVGTKTPEDLGQQIRERCGPETGPITLICRARSSDQTCCLVHVGEPGNPATAAQAIGGSSFGHRSVIAIYTLSDHFTCATRAAGTLSDFGCTCQP